MIGAMSESGFIQDVGYEVDQSLLNGGRAAAVVQAEAARHPGENSGIVIALVDGFENEGRRLVDALLPRYKDAATNPDVSKASLQRAFREGLDLYLTACGSWGRLPDAFSGSRNALLDRAILSLRDRLHGRIDYGIRGLEAAPKKRWTERNPARYALSLLVAGALLTFFANAALKLLFPT